MSLTRELNKKQSPFRQLVEGCAPALAIAGGRSPEGKWVAERLGFYDLVKARSLAPLPDGVTDARRHSPTVGMAFDIRTRMMLGQFEPRRSASAMGIDVFNHLLAPILPNGQHISDVLGDAFLEAEWLTRDGDDVDQDYASIVFAWCESIYRAGGRAIRSSLGERLSAARNVDEVYDSIPPLMLEDLARLRIVNQRQIKHWRLHMRHGAFFISNPSFSGDFLVGGADGDWFIDDTLFDFKVVDKISAPWVRKVLMQLMGYLILDLDNDYQAQRIGNQRQIKHWRLHMRHGAFFISNPSFSGDFLVGGADGDWFIDDTLFDFKVVDKISAPWVRKVLMQLMGYLILDLDNDYQAQRIGIWLPRQATVKTWAIEEILGGDASKTLSKARRNVQGAMKRKIEATA